MVAVEDFLAALAKDWPAVRVRLDEVTAAAVHDLLARLHETTDPTERRDITHLIAEQVLPVLPPDHPARHRLSDVRSAATLPMSRSLEAALRAMLGDEYTVDAEKLAQRRILATPTLHARAMRDAGDDPDVPALIRLDRDDGVRVLPRFQFDRDNTPLDVVLRVNTVLGAEQDPWGVADWWLSRNVWLREVPVQAIGRRTADELIAAARAAVED